ncbi:helix-turn-helix transcriptional regulator [Clostridium sp. BSD9I1]|uniref:helix-turn-helix transcriptional regulator n=1 Tax=Clostridium sp. BSD9I1 TaxID=2003589 RepID=UPI001FA8A644|nr:helix-turn-helix transcriptional regulator [Clostridium sp. BSD9I1]
MKFFRLNNNLTQEEVAQKLRVSVSSYNMMENGRRKVSLETAKKLEDIFNTTIDEIFFKF